MHEVTKEKFKEIFLTNGTASEGWGPDYWNEFYENPKKENMTYWVELPANAEENRSRSATTSTPSLILKALI